MKYFQTNGPFINKNLKYIRYICKKKLNYPVVDFNNIVLENENFPTLHKLKLLFCVIVAIPFVFTLLLVLLAHHVNFNTLFAQGKLANQETPI